MPPHPADRLTVIIPAFDEAASVSETVDSVLRQTTPPPACRWRFEGWCPEPGAGLCVGARALRRLPALVHLLQADPGLLRQPPDRIGVLLGLPDRQPAGGRRLDGAHSAVARGRPHLQFRIGPAVAVGRRLTVDPD